mgnify:CR=1 FL=1
MKELWKDIIGYGGMYQISNFGKVRSWKKLGAFGGMLKKPKILKQIPDKYGYLFVHLRSKNKSRNEYTHLLVLNTFVGLCPKSMEGCHSDGNSKNNNVKNLRWDTRKNNCLDRSKHETTSNISKNINAKLTKIDIIDIRNLHKKNYTMTHLSKIYKVSIKQISRIIKREHWKCV